MEGDRAGVPPTFNKPHRITGAHGRCSLDQLRCLVPSHRAEAMKRRSRAGGKPVKARRRREATLKRRNVPKAARRRTATAGGLETEVARLTRERDQALEQLSEALEQHTATAEVLKVISGSPGQLEPVFNTMLENATRICEATYGTLYLREGDGFRRPRRTTCRPLTSRLCAATRCSGHLQIPQRGRSPEQSKWSTSRMSGRYSPI